MILIEDSLKIAAACEHADKLLCEFGMSPRFCEEFNHLDAQLVPSLSYEGRNDAIDMIEAKIVNLGVNAIAKIKALS